MVARGTNRSARRDLSGGGPLRGVRVAVTRPTGQDGELSRRLAELGAEVVSRPLIRIDAPANPAPLLEAASAVSTYDWVVFTSANGLTRFCDAMDASGEGVAELAATRIACVGPATSEAFRARVGRSPDLSPRSDFVAEGLLGAFRGEGDLSGVRVLLPQAEAARPVLREELSARGAVVDAVVTHRTVPDPAGAAALRRDLDRGAIDVIALTAPSAVSSFVAALGMNPGPVRIAAIGPVTAAAAGAAGLPVHAVATEHTARGLATAVVVAAGREQEFHSPRTGAP